MNHKLVLLLILFFSHVATRAAGNLAFRYYGLEFGLTDNAIHDIAEDKYGFIWIATNEGLNRVAGSKIVRYYKGEDGNGLSGNELNCLLDDPKNSIMWIGTQRDGLIACHYDEDRMEYFRQNSSQPESLVTNDITDLKFDEKGNLWVATYSNGIDYLDRKTGHFTHHRYDDTEGLPNNKFWCIEYDPQTSTLFGGHVEGGFSVIDPATRSARNYSLAAGLAGDEVLDISLDNDYVWVATDKGLSRFKRSTGEIVSFKEEGFVNPVRCIADKGSGLLLTMDNQGVVAFDKQSHKFSPLEPDFTAHADDYSGILSRSNPNKLITDSHSNIIVGTLHEGIAAFTRDSSGFLVLRLPFDDNINEVSLTYPDVRNIVSGGGKLWFGTNGRGLSGAGRFAPGATRILATLFDTAGTLWVAGNDGVLHEATPSSGNVRHHRLNLPAHREISLASRGDSLYIGTIDGIYVFDKRKGSISRRFDVERNFIYCLETDNEGNLWVGSYGNGASVIDAEGNLIRTYARRNGFVSNTINDICAVGADVWLATGEGLVKIGHGADTFQIMAHPQRSVKSAVADKGGNIWYATGGGIGVVTTEGKTFFFDSQVPLSGFNNAAAECDDGGRLYFGSSHGVLSFNPEHVLSGSWLPQPMISGFTVNGGKKGTDTRINTTRTGKVSLSSGQNNFSIAVSPSNFFVEHSAFEYRLIGLEDKWYPMHENGVVTFRDLPYGSYVFQVRNAVMEEYSEGKVASLKITINPPFYLQWWAKLLYGAMIAGLGVVGFMWYRNRVRHNARKSIEAEKSANQRLLHEERMKFFTNVTHELRTPLTLINGPLDDLLKGNTLSGTDRRKVEMIQKNAMRLLTLVNRLLDFRKTETSNKQLCVARANIVDTVKETALKYMELNRNPDVTITVNTPAEELPMYFDAEVLTIILDNLISNAVKYTEAGMISVGAAPEQKDGERYVRISVKDTGYGIGKEALPHIFDRYYQENGHHQASGTGIGLALVKALVELHKGEISVESAKDVGTNFSLLLLRDFDYPGAIHAAQEEKPADPDAGAEGETADSDGATTGGSDETLVLVVEDNPEIRDYIRQSLSDTFEVKTASNGRDGLEIARNEVPDIVVTDVMMPVMDGMEMTRILKNDVATSHIPVVMLTAKDSQSAREEGYEAGVDSYLTKPFSASLLKSRINNIVARRHMLTEFFKSNDTLNDDVQDVDPKSEKPVPTPPADTLAKDREKLEMSLGQLDREFLSKIDSLIIEGVGKGKTVNIDYLTDAMCMSRATLYRKMKALTGMSTNEYMRLVKVTKAKELMLEGRLTLNEIASATGFNSIGYFRESFKAVLGMPPGDYLKTLKSNRLLTVVDGDDALEDS